VALVLNLLSLRSLIGKSLVQTETQPLGEQRFLLLETLREFALEQLRAHGDEAEMRQRHYLAYLHLFRTGDASARRRSDKLVGALGTGTGQSTRRLAMDA
jgi:predicted ATPase